MRYIGFQNFRRFEDLKSIDLSPISIFVGGNNSGKSTVVKGILTVLGFLNDDCDLEYIEDDNDFEEQNERLDRVYISHNQRFRFNKDFYAHIGTCQRALRRGTDSKDIRFIFGYGSAEFDIIVNVDDDSEDATSGRVKSLCVFTPSTNTRIKFDLINWTAELVFVADDPEYYHRKAERDVSDGYQETMRKDYYQKKYEYFSRFHEDIHLSVKLPDIVVGYDNSLISNLIHSVELIITASMNKKNNTDNDDVPFRRRVKGLELINLTEDQRGFISNSLNWSSARNAFFFGSRLRMESIEYIYAHAVTQSIIYSAKDTNDYLVKTVHDFANCRISRSSKGDKNEIYRFIKKWMEQFGIGVDYNVHSVGGEAHIVKIKNADGQSINMADLGMGSIQLMILLFRIGTVMDQSNAYNTTVILEEPEQNLHPKLQSKLAEFLHELYSKYRICFIVETHSEYLIRKTQVMVGELYNTDEKLRDNPFRVYYFPSDGNPYDMEYTPSGKFAKPFGEGFFDEAANLHMTVLRNSRK